MGIVPTRFTPRRRIPPGHAPHRVDGREQHVRPGRVPGCHTVPHGATRCRTVPKGVSWHRGTLNGTAIMTPRRSTTCNRMENGSASFFVRLSPVATSDSCWRFVLAAVRSGVHLRRSHGATVPSDAAAVPALAFPGPPTNTPRAYHPQKPVKVSCRHRLQESAGRTLRGKVKP